jgi:hypothetical protein
VIIYGRDSEDYDANLKGFLERCAKLGIKPDREKCQHKVKKIKFLGHMVGEDGLKPDPEKIAEVKDMDVPTCTDK